MAWLGYNRVCPFILWLLRSSQSFLRRSATGVLTTLAILLAIRWRDDRGSPGVAEICDENRLEATGSPEKVEESRCEGQREAAAGREDAGSSRRSGGHEDDDEFDSEDYRVETTDELYCGYDSTWETEVCQKTTLTRTRRPAACRYYKFREFEIAAKDMQNYRHDYPSQIRPERWNHYMPYEDKPNLGFYLGKRASSIDGVYIDSFHNEWKGDYATLEGVHTYIQWLFPLQEPGVNDEALTLTKEEIKDFLESDTAKENLLKSYKVMLDFYGIQLCDKETGEVMRASHWRDRFYNLNTHTHNKLRITRILKCLGTLGYPHYQAPLVHFFLKETLIHGELPKIKDSVLSYFVFAILDKKQRRNLIKFAYLNYDPKEEFVWCPRKIQMMWSGLSVSKQQKVMNDKDGL
ncbi:opioid growth factor receptor-like [Xiphias gladius]|uniref:opioid growth factor receptor-like n=1 Tax=Xiphias gladius TaxID=8245 RepID=UPI001A994895|nr:opioid growth factor receptor-like [Xiphias gladius]